MKYINHKYKNVYGSQLPEDNCAIYRSDFCMYCLKSVKELLIIDVNGIDLTLKYLRNNTEIIVKCLTEEEYIIKKALE